MIKNLKKTNDIGLYKINDVFDMLFDAKLRNVASKLEAIYVALCLEGYSCFVEKSIIHSTCRVQFSFKTGIDSYSLFDISFRYGFGEDLKTYIESISVKRDNIKSLKMNSIFKFNSYDRDKFEECLDKLLEQIAEM